MDPNLLIDRGRPGLGLAASNGSVKSAKLFLEVRGFGFNVEAFRVLGFGVLGFSGFFGFRVLGF